MSVSDPFATVCCDWDGCEHEIEVRIDMDNFQYALTKSSLRQAIVNQASYSGWDRVCEDGECRELCPEHQAMDRIRYLREQVECWEHKLYVMRANDGDL